MNRYALVFLAVLPFCIGSAIPSLPKIKLCKGEEPQLSQCWKDTLKEVVHSLKDGVPQHNIPPLAPLYVPSTAADTDTYTADLSNMNCNFSSYDIINVTCQPNTRSATIEILIKELRLTGNTDVKGHYKGIDLSGVGTCDVSFLNVTCMFDLEWENFEVNGVKYHNMFGEYNNIHFGHIQLHSYEVLKDASDNHQKLNEHLLSVKSSPDYEKFLHTAEKTFFNHFLRYVLRAYNSYQAIHE